MVTRFDIDGHVATFGHPEWARTHEAAFQTSPVVSALVEGGATCIGTTVVDELAYGLVSYSIIFLFFPAGKLITAYLGGPIPFPCQ